MAKGKPSLNDVQKAVKAAKDVYDIVQPLVSDHVPAVKEFAARKAKDAADAAGGAVDQLKQRKLTKEQQKQLEEEKKRAVGGSISFIDAKEFAKAFEAGIPEDGDMTRGYMAISGCYAIATLPSAKTKDVADYAEVYVGGSEVVGFDVYRQLNGFGNIDVYADFKFDQPMRVLIFPCESDQIESRVSDLRSSLQAWQSYNKWEALT